MGGGQGQGVGQGDGDWGGPGGSQGSVTYVGTVAVEITAYAMLMCSLIGSEAFVLASSSKSCGGGDC